MKKYKVIFSDLDGTLIETISGKTFPKGIWDMKTINQDTHKVELRKSNLNTC